MYRGPYNRGYTLLFAACSFASFAFMIALPWFTPPWYILLPLMCYVFLSSGLIALGRIEGNNEARGFVDMIRKMSDENKRNLN